MAKVKILGAGSIGNHLSNAARSMGWDVLLCDIDSQALQRSRDSIFPSRYGKWDKAIETCLTHDAPQGGFDYIFVGTPPESHMKLAQDAVNELPRAVLVEKPLCTPDMSGAQYLLDLAAKNGVAVFSGYDHVVGNASKGVANILQKGNLGVIETLDVEFREHWGGIFAAHPWLDGPGDSYLGYWKKGGGASGEHSHAANLWQHFAHLCDAGRVVEVNAMMEFVTDGTLDYDKLCLMNLRTEHGLTGRVVQDVVTAPPRKWARIQGRDSYIEWHCGYKNNCDAVIHGRTGEEPKIDVIKKSRPDDFIQELSHISQALQSDPSRSPISLQRGMDTMLVVAAAHKSSREKATVRIDYTAGYSEAALAPAN